MPVGDDAADPQRIEVADVVGSADPGVRSATIATRAAAVTKPATKVHSLPLFIGPLLADTRKRSRASPQDRKEMSPAQYGRLANELPARRARCPGRERARE